MEKIWNPKLLHTAPTFYFIPNNSLFLITYSYLHLPICIKSIHTETDLMFIVLLWQAQPTQGGANCGLWRLRGRIFNYTIRQLETILQRMFLDSNYPRVPGGGRQQAWLHYLVFSQFSLKFLGDTQQIFCDMYLTSRYNFQFLVPTCAEKNHNHVNTK